MQALVQETATGHTPETLAAQFAGEAGLVLLRSAPGAGPFARYSLVAARPFLTFRAWGSRCVVVAGGRSGAQFGNPWHVLEEWLGRYELLDQLDLPFPLGGCFGYWGYDLKHFVEPRLRRSAVNDLELPDCEAGFYDSLVVFDHALAKTWVISTGLRVDGSRDESRAQRQLEFWQARLAEPVQEAWPARGTGRSGPVLAHLSRADLVGRIRRAQEYIRAGDIYQVNLAQRLAVPSDISGWELFLRLSAISPAPYSAFLDCGEFQLVSSSPELFLRLSGRHILTRPIKGTRPRSADPARDAELARELQSSPKEAAELVMITDLLRNDLGRVCEYGSVVTPELRRLERFAQVQHMVSTVEGRLRGDLTHLEALACCFPGGSVTGAPKIRAMEIIEELEPTARGPYTGCLGYLGFNQESQLSIIIRTAIRGTDWTWFHAGAGIVADSQPEAEYEEMLDKARGILAAVSSSSAGVISPGAPIGVGAGLSGHE